MPTYDYKCYECEKVFETKHGMNEKCKECSFCGSNKIKKMFNSISFYVPGGTQKFETHGYTGRNQDLVKRMKGNKDYQSGYRREIGEQSKKSLADFKTEQEMNKASETFQKMKAEGEKMTKAEKEQIKKEFGIKKGIKTGKIGL
jgi:putative FmdB family regulatory protein